MVVTLNFAPSALQELPSPILFFAGSLAGNASVQGAFGELANGIGITRCGVSERSGTFLPGRRPAIEKPSP